MTLAPGRRLVTAAAMWTGGAVLAVVWPALWGPLGGALAVLAALVAWDARIVRRAGPFTAERVLPERAAVGRAAEVTIRVRNGGATPLVADVVDELPRDLVAEEPRFDAVALPGGATVVLRHAIRPVARGDRALGPVVVVVRSRLALCRRLVVVPPGPPIRVYPDATRFLRREALDLRRVLAAIGVRPARRRGDGMEFDSLREFVVGDDPRRVDWAATARRGRPITRLYRHERRHTVMIALDASRLMGGRVGEQTKLDHAIDSALALAHAALVSGDRVGMLVFDREVRAYLAPRAHRRALGAFAEVCRTATPRAVEADYRALALALAMRQRQRALLVVLTDFVEADAVTLVAPAVVLARRHRVLLVALRDPVFTRLDAGATDGGPLALYRRVVLDEVLHERESVLSRLRRAGVQTIDLVPEAITGAVLNRYLELRHGPDR